MNNDEPLFSYGYGYGWTGMPPAKFADNIKRAALVARKLWATQGFDAVAYTGSSGAAIAFPIALALGVPIIYVRKENEESHGSSVECNGTDKIEKYLVVDDFISSGSTVNRIVKKITEAAVKRNAFPLKCMGILLYDEANRKEITIDNQKIRVYGKTSLSKIKLT